MSRLAMDPFFSSRLLATPLALHERGLVGALALARQGGAAELGALDTLGGAPASGRGIVRTHAGVTIVSVDGMLTHRHAPPGATPYPVIRAAFLTALADPAVRAIALDIDSAGGEIGGCFELADTIFAARGRKPIWAICSDTALSAAYALASAADRVVVPRSGSVGGVGVLALFPDQSVAMKKAGVALHAITFGAAKTDGLPSIPMSPLARARFQAQIDTIGKIFVANVARNRNVKAATVRAMEAGTYLGQAGVRAGLADAVMAPFDAIDELVALAQRRGQSARHSSASASRPTVPAPRRPAIAAPARAAVARLFDFSRLPRAIFR
jgi:ClpP class serine protease